MSNNHAGLVAHQVFGHPAPTSVGGSRRLTGAEGW